MRTSFHARYGEYNGIIDINSLKMIEGDLPRRALKLDYRLG